MTDTDELAATLQQLAERAVRARGVHGLLLGVESDDGSASVRVAAGDSRCAANTSLDVLDRGGRTGASSRPATMTDGGPATPTPTGSCSPRSSKP